MRADPNANAWHTDSNPNAWHTNPNPNAREPNAHAYCDSNSYA